MKRRTVLRSMLAAVTLAGGLGGGVTARAKGTVPKEIIKPARLQKGMTVGLIAPASNTAENEGIRFAIDIVRSLGFKVKEGQFLFSRNQYLAGTDGERGGYWFQY
jgi:muramoyltetrapeptide carboxypeptidase